MRGSDVVHALAATHVGRASPFFESPISQLASATGGAMLFARHRWTRDQIVKADRESGKFFSRYELKRFDQSVDDFKVHKAGERWFVFGYCRTPMCKLSAWRVGEFCPLAGKVIPVSALTCAPIYECATVREMKDVIDCYVLTDNRTVKPCEMDERLG